MHELDALKTIEEDDINNLPILRDAFEVQGPRGSHRCFLISLLGSKTCPRSEEAHQIKR